MTPLDLSNAVPRSGHERLGGIAFAARTLDKVRALLPGGNIGPYKIPGISERMLAALGVEEAAFQAKVAEAAGEAEVGEWLRNQAGPERVAAWNAVALQPIRDDAQRADLERRYPFMCERRDISSLIDMLDLDDGRTVPIRSAVSS